MLSVLLILVPAIVAVLSFWVLLIFLVPSKARTSSHNIYDHSENWIN